MDGSNVDDATHGGPENVGAAANLGADREPVRAATAPPTMSDDATHDVGGDPVCWAPRVCPDCGLFVPVEPPTVCPRCGAAVGVD